MVVGTPGRLVALLRSGSLSGATVATCVLDEADRLLHESMYDSVAEVYGHLPKRKQVPLPPIIMAAFVTTAADVLRRLVSTSVSCLAMKFGMHSADVRPVGSAPMSGSHAHRQQSAIRNPQSARCRRCAIAIGCAEWSSYRHIYRHMPDVRFGG